ncbi:PQQ-like beta-propeller repeat protein [Salinirubrum litoreum]|uniref:PQQ-binding-like beta-propeller repeat protein n=1 Tax=Salinirubrum litoreum TaxID=1126234 RepID=A0ABD5RGW3_9EURY
MTDQTYSRRQTLAALGVAAVGGLAGCSTLTDLRGVRPLWRQSIAARLNAGPPVATADRVVLGTQDKRVYAFGADDGTREFAVETGGPVETAPTVSPTDGFVHAHSTDGDLYAIDEDGTVAWHEEGVHSRAVLARAGSLLVQFDPRSDTVTGYDAATGTRRFERVTSAYRFPGLTRDVFVLLDPAERSERRLAALSPADGAVRWRSDPGGYRGLTVDADRLATVSEEGVELRSLADGSLQWRTEFDAAVDTLFGGAVHLDGDAYVKLRPRDGPGVVVALDGETGEERWRRTGGYEIERIVSTDETVLAVSSVDDPDGGILIRIDGFDRDGTRRWQRTTDIAIGGVVETCTLVDGTLVVGSDRRIRAFATGDGSPLWQYDPDGSRMHVHAADDALYVAYRDDAGIARLPVP